MSEAPQVIVTNRSDSGCLGYLWRGCGCLLLIAVGLIVAGFVFGWDWASSDTRAVQKSKAEPPPLNQAERMRRELPATAPDQVAPVTTEMKNKPGAGDESFFK